MRAVVIHAAHDLRIEEREVPAIDDHQVLVRIRAGGICGSDLHYYHHGGFGVVRVRHPMALGHEIAGVVDKVGAAVTGLAPGVRVAVNPSRACGECVYCRKGMRQHCMDMRFMGSAMRMPHVEGGFREFVAVDASQAVTIADSLSFGEAAMAEPLAVCLHAAARAGELQGRRVLITGCGPIGMLCLLVAQQGGAAEIAVTDMAEKPLTQALALGADRAINSAAEPDALAPFKEGKGHFDILFECSGAQAALRGALDTLRPGGIAVQVGIGGDMNLPMNLIVAREIELRGSFRFEPEFALAVELMGRGKIDVKPLISATFPFADAVEAFELASDRSRSMKVQLGF
ncbi:MAG: L-idonate 5-dehydrogenase [Beijerinckiaceae bacterium]